MATTSPHRAARQSSARRHRVWLDPTIGPGFAVPMTAPFRSTRPDDRAGVRGYSSVPVHVTAAATSDGFDWIDALIGGVGGIATALLIMGGAFLLLSQRNRPRTA